MESRPLNFHLLLYILYIVLFWLQHLGDSTKALQDIASGKHPFCKELAAAKSPMVIVGSVALQRSDADAIHTAVTTIANSLSKPENKEWRTLNVLQRVSMIQCVCYTVGHRLSELVGTGGCSDN